MRYSEHMKKSTGTGFEQLEALVENALSEFRTELSDMRRQIEVKDTQIAALLERVREANTIAAKAAPSRNDR
jgi:ppGpp synthetase/RelA/SpoT-type nucleotidyltranferase